MSRSYQRGERHQMGPTGQIPGVLQRWHVSENLDHGQGYLCSWSSGIVLKRMSVCVSFCDERYPSPLNQSFIVKLRSQVWTILGGGYFHFPPKNYHPFFKKMRLGEGWGYFFILLFLFKALNFRLGLNLKKRKYIRVGYVIWSETIYLTV